MEQAIGTKISDYLTKPVNPSQVLLACKKFLEGKKIAEQQVSRDYINEFNEISAAVQLGTDADGWISVHEKLTGWSMELDAHPESGLRQTLNDQIRECNVEFSKFIERNYRRWLESQDRPVLSVDIAEKHLIPALNGPASVFFMVIDCLRLDQWLVMESVLREFFNVSKEYYLSILPTATPYARNAIFSGAYPDEIEKRFRDMGSMGRRRQQPQPQ